jgi:peptidyl-prolyl cis-trans isomerase A (cyclophilin A)
MLKKMYGLTALSITIFFSSQVNATVVQFQTVLGPFEINLYDESTPATVANFLDYVNSNAYDNVVMHRVEDNFVVQGGGFTYEGTNPLSVVPDNGPVINEPEFSNVRGTIAMAKLGGDPNSATTEWFINLSDNSANLDVQNGGFTVFGEVTGNGMDVIDAIENLPLFDFGGALMSIPLRNYTTQNATDGVEVTDQHLVLITAIVVLDAALDTAANLSPVENTLIDQSSPNTPPLSSGGSGGGGCTVGGDGSHDPTLPLLLLICTVYVFRRRCNPIE